MLRIWRCGYSEYIGFLIALLTVLLFAVRKQILVVGFMVCAFILSRDADD